MPIALAHPRMHPARTPAGPEVHFDLPEPYWACPPETLVERLGSGSAGLSSAEAALRLQALGPNELGQPREVTWTAVLWGQLRSPLLLLLVFAACASAVTGEWRDASIVLAILVTSVGLGASREYRAQSAAEALRARVGTRAVVVRDGRRQSVPATEVVPGDVLLLGAGSLVPADAVVLEATDLFVNQAALTGESFPVEKRPAVSAKDAPVAERSGCVYLGTNVRSGTARCLAVHTARATEYGEIARRLALRPPDTEFDRGLRRFGRLLTIAMLVMVLLVFAANVFLGRPPVDTLLYSIALAVGLSPELLPAILSVNLARAAQAMAGSGVLVKRLNAIENLGSMDVLCTDKTGTLTEGVVRLEGAYGPDGAPAREVLAAAAVNAELQSGLANALDEAILRERRPAPGEAEKLTEIPYDFVRRRVSVVARGPGGIRLISKGAFESVLEACTRTPDGAPLAEESREALRARFRAWSEQGLRVLAVAERTLEARARHGRADERDLTFAGFLTFLDRPKRGVAEAIADLGRLGVAVKVISGDAAPVVHHVAHQVGLRDGRVLTGRELAELHDDALWRAAEDVHLFAEVDPNQKERIIRALRRGGHVVGFLGDGVNDALAMRAADTSLSVEQAVDVAREAADFVLLERNLDVIRRGIEDGRRTFANTLKYVLTTTSANLGNMASMAVASIFLPFLPLLAGQVLLNNFLSDIPALAGTANDRVDPELVDRPRRWDMRFIARFMVGFGMLSSVFDGLTFAALLWPFAAGPELFRTGWFLESLLTELAIALVVRTRRRCFRSRPGTALWVSTVGVAALAFAAPYATFAGDLGFVPLPATVLGVLVGITVLYVLAAELAKPLFFRQA